MKLRVKHIPRKAGVYQCTTPSGSYYIGRAADMKERVYQHHALLKRGKHANQRLQRSYDKYGGRMKWSVLFTADTIQTAIQWEADYLRMFWGDSKLMNMRKGDGFTAEENERNKRRPVYAMNRDTGQYIKLNYVSEFGAMISAGRGCVLPNAVYGNTLRECQSVRLQYLRKEVNRLYKKQLTQDVREWKRRHKALTPKQRFAYICRNVQTGEHKYVEQYDKPDCSGNWQARRVHDDWPLMLARPVFGWHPTYGKMVWRSIGECSKHLNRSRPSVLKAIRRERKTCAGWTLDTHGPC